MKASHCGNGVIVERGKHRPFNTWQTRENDLTERQQRRIINNKHKRRIKGVV